MLNVVLVTVGDPGRLTGGYLTTLEWRSSPRDTTLIWVSFLSRASLSLWRCWMRPALMSRAGRTGAQALVLDSIAAAYLGPWLLLRTPRVPVVGMLHQPPGGIDYRLARTVVQRVLDLTAYRAARCLLVASESLRDQLVAEGVPRGKLVVVPPGRDVPPLLSPPR